MRALARVTCLTLSSVALGLAAAGCGGSSENEPRTDTTPANTATAETVTTHETTTSASGPGPSGVLGTSSVGDVRVGMSEDEVVERFGEPDRKEPVNYGPPGDPPPQEDWVWQLKNGEFRLSFETQKKTLRSYSTTSTLLETRSGYAVGDLFEKIHKRLQQQLRPAGAGTGYLLSEGKPGSYPGLIFVVKKGVVTAIAGGHSPPAGD